LQYAPYPDLVDLLRAKSGSGLVSPQRGHRLTIRVLVDVRDCPSNQVGVIVKCSHSGIAEQADDPSHGPGLVIVIDLLGFPAAADGTQTALAPNEFVDLVSANPVAPHQVIVTLASPVVASQGFTTLPGMTRFAVAVVAGLGVLFLGKSGGGFD